MAESETIEMESFRQPEIKVATFKDLSLLEKALPSSFHHQRLQRQNAGKSTYLVAWIDGSPVGNLDLRWSGNEQPAVVEKFPNCPELNGIEVCRERRSRGIGSALIEAAESQAKEKGYTVVGMGVDTTNDRAKELYLKLGYEVKMPYVDRWVENNDNGQKIHEDACEWLVKDL